MQDIRSTSWRSGVRAVLLRSNGVNVNTLGSERCADRWRATRLVHGVLSVGIVRVPLLMRRRRYVAIDVNTLPDFTIFAPCARWMGASPRHARNHA